MLMVKSTKQQMAGWDGRNSKQANAKTYAIELQTRKIGDNNNIEPIMMMNSLIQCSKRFLLLSWINLTFILLQQQQLTF